MGNEQKKLSVVTYWSTLKSKSNERKKINILNCPVGHQSNGTVNLANLARFDCSCQLNPQKDNVEIKKDLSLLLALNAV